MFNLFFMFNYLQEELYNPHPVTVRFPLALPVI
jgi:hypothetical protein